jgi:Dolichyl-phosphate-mannose-protein mannosyltransferase
MNRRPALIFWLCAAASILASRLAHANLLWADEDYHLAAAIQVLYGKFPYRDFWYDKPPLNLAFYLISGARAGLVLRVADTLFVVLCCALAYRFASRLWSRREGFFAAGALAFFSIFYLTPAVLPLEPDTLMIAPHLGAVYMAWRRKPLLAGVLAALAFQLNVKGVFVLAFCLVVSLEGGLQAVRGFSPAWTEAGLKSRAGLSPPYMQAGARMLAGFLGVNALVLLALSLTGSLASYWTQVWRWGWLYLRAASGGGFLQLLGWLGFHAALILAALWYWKVDEKKSSFRPLLIWFVLALAFSAIGLRSAPRYFNLLLPPLAIAGARGMSLANRRGLALIAALFVIPAVRFGPRYFELRSWKDTAMDRESHRAAEIVSSAARRAAQSKDTIFVWGYRPDIIAYTRLPIAGRYLDSQPLTGVPADRHLFDARTAAPEWAGENRSELARSHPAFLVDGLSLYNPQLALSSYPDLAPWFAQYCPLARAGLIAIYAPCRQ